MIHYRVVILWSEEDKAFLADVPELQGCISHGATRAEALANVELMIAEWMMSAEQLGWKIPTPLNQSK
jgi:predicted RNase H-like HicB family nuclease